MVYASLDGKAWHQLTRSIQFFTDMILLRGRNPGLRNCDFESEISHGARARHPIGQPRLRCQIIVAAVGLQAQFSALGRRLSQATRSKTALRCLIQPTLRLTWGRPKKPPPLTRRVKGSVVTDINGTPCFPADEGLFECHSMYGRSTDWTAAGLSRTNNGRR